MVQRAQSPADQLGIADYSMLMSLTKDSNPQSRIFGGHYSRCGEPWSLPVSASALSAGLAADRKIGLAGSTCASVTASLSPQIACKWAILQVTGQAESY
jgi:hypothetical protein